MCLWKLHFSNPAAFVVLVRNVFRYKMYYSKYVLLTKAVNTSYLYLELATHVSKMVDYYEQLPTYYVVVLLYVPKNKYVLHYESIIIQEIVGC